MVHRLDSRESLLVVEAQKLVEEVNRFVRNIALVLGSDETRPWLLRVSGKQDGTRQLTVDRDEYEELTGQGCRQTRVRGQSRISVSASRISGEKERGH